MNASDFEELVLARIAATSGHDEHRGYVGMSRVGHCPRAVFFDVIRGVPASLEMHAIHWLGNRVEACLLSELFNGHGNGVMIRPGRELVAFGGRVKGHTDAELVPKTLLEIKSTTFQKIMAIRRERRLPHSHFEQAQTYMHFGQFQRAFILYMPRDYGLPYVHELRYIAHVGATCAAKLLRIVEAVDSDVPPACQCGRCPGAGMQRMEIVGVMAGASDDARTESAQAIDSIRVSGQAAVEGVLAGIPEESPP